MTYALQGMATEKQENYLESLIKKCPDHKIAGLYTFAKMSKVLTKAQASEWIETLKPVAATVKPQPTAPLTVDKLPTAQSAPSSADSPKPAYGIYKVGDYYYNFVEKSVNGFKTSVLMRLHIKTKIEWDPTTQQHKSVKVGSWKKIGSIYTAKKLLTGLTAFTLPEAKAFGHEFGFCCRCGAYLSDPVSVANGIGPVCQGYWA